MIITLKDLKAKGACSSQVALFEATFGASVVVTKGLLLKWRHQFNLEWVAIHYLTEEHWKAYDEAVTSAQKAYQEAVAPARKAYQEAVASALKAYDGAVAVALWKQIKDMK
jgi:hypothetical protein